MNWTVEFYCPGARQGRHRHRQTLKLRYICMVPAVTHTCTEVFFLNTPECSRSLTLILLSLNIQSHKVLLLTCVLVSSPSPITNTWGKSTYKRRCLSYLPGLNDQQSINWSYCFGPLVKPHIMETYIKDSIKPLPLFLTNERGKGMAGFMVPQSTSTFPQ